MWGAALFLLLAGLRGGARLSKARALLCRKPTRKPQVGKRLSPLDALPRGAWWKVFDDPQLNDLAEQINISNQTVLAAEAQVRQALALVQIARASYFPFVTGGFSFTRTQNSTTSHEDPGSGRDRHLGLSPARQPVLGGRRLGTHPPHGRGQPEHRRGQCG